MGVRADYMWTRGYDVLRSVNVNAPVDGVRPDPTIGNISEISATGRQRFGPAVGRASTCACRSAASSAT